MPVTHFKLPEKYEYQNGFGSYHEYACRAPAAMTQLTHAIGLRLFLARCP